MLENMENLKIIDILRGESVPVLRYPSRFSHALSLKVLGATRYTFEGRTLTTHPGELIYIPKGAGYRADRLTDASEYLLFNFDADMPPMPPQVFAVDGYPDLNYISEQLPAMWLFGDAAERMRCYAAFYDLLAFSLATSRAGYAYTTRLDRIAPAVDYLREHIFDPELRAESLHALAGMSDTYFRKIFRANFGVSPREYIINKRLDQARSLILSGAYPTIAEVALAVGYSDPLYFSRAYSAHFGTPASSAG